MLLKDLILTLVRYSDSEDRFDELFAKLQNAGVPTEFPEDFEPKFVVEFINIIPVDKKKKCLETYCEINTKKHASQLIWLDSLDFKTANAFLNLMHTHEIKIEYSEIYNCSDDLRETDVIKAFAQRANLPLDETVEFKFEIPPERISFVETSEFPDECKLLKKRIHSREKVRNEAFSLLEKYREKNLKESGETFIGKWGVPSIRGIAYQRLIKTIATDDAHWSGMKALRKEAEFRNQAGYYDSESSGARFLVPFTLWRRVKAIKNRIRRQQAFFKRFKNNKLLIRVLSDDTIYSTLDQNDLALIFKYCNRSLFLVLLKKYARLSEEIWRPLRVEGHELDAKTINAMLHINMGSIAEVNTLRNKFNISSIIPVNYERAGLPEDPRRQKLTKALLYQYSEAELRAAEKFLFTQYGGVFANHFFPEMKSDELPKKPNMTFFHFPVSDPLFVANDDTNLNFSKRSLAFKNSLKSLVDSHVSNNANPVVFSGILNLNNAHWIPYFIYKNANNEIQIICIDPSPSIKKWPEEGEIFQEDDVCPKFKAHQKLKKIFREIFPNCIFSDPNITQQIRQRDCGPNALTVLEDAFRTSFSDYPLLTVVDGRLKMNTKALTINCNKQRVYDYGSGTYFYSPEALKIGKKNRKDWAMRLLNIDEVITLCFSLPLSVQSILTTVMTDPYHYKKNVANQNLHDQIEDLYCKVAGKIGDFSLIQEKFVRTLALPNMDDLKTIIESNQSLIDEIKSYGTTLDAILTIVVDKNLRGYYVPALIANFDPFLKMHRLDKCDTETVQTLNAIINTYVKNSEQASAGFFALLLPNEKAQVIKAITEKAEQGLGQIIKEFHLQTVTKALIEQVGNLLKKMLGAPNQRLDSVVVEIIALFKTMQSVGPSFEYMTTSSLEDLKEIVKVAIKTFIQQCIQQTERHFSHIIGKFSLSDLAVLIPEPDVKIGLLSPAINRLLPDEKTVNPETDWNVLQQEDLFLKEPHDTSPNALSSFVTEILDAKIKTLVEHRLSTLLTDPILTERINQRLADRADILANYSITQLNSMTTNQDEAQCAAANLGLFELINIVQPTSNYIYLQAIKKLVDLLRQHIEERLKNKISFLFPIVTANLHLSDVNFAALSNEDKINTDVLVMGVVKKLVKPNHLEAALLPDEKGEQDNSPIFEVFVRNYKTSIMQQIKNVDRQISKFCGTANNYLSLFDIIEADLICFTTEAGERVTQEEFSSENLDFFFALQRDINDLILAAKKCYQYPATEVAAKIAELNRDLKIKFQKFIEFLTEHYRMGDVNLARFTTRLRIRLFQTLNIPLPLNCELIPSIINPELAKRIDQAIKNYFGGLLRAIPTDFAVMARFNVRMPCYVIAEENKPWITYAKFLTRKLLTQLIANWASKCGNEWTFALKLLVAAVNKIPMNVQDNEDLSYEWCVAYILRPILQNTNVHDEAKINKTTEKFLFALANSRIFMPATPQVGEENAQIKLSDVENVVAVYKAAQTAKPLQVARFVKHATFANQDDTEEKLASYLKHSFWEKPNDIRRIDIIIERIRRRHPPTVNADIVLDRGDLELLHDALRQRWKKLRKAKGDFVPNYTTYPLATDRAYYALAEIVRIGLNNLTQPIVMKDTELLKGVALRS